MSSTSDNALQQFKNLVGIKFQLYNSLFTALPFHRIEKTGFLVPILLLNCEEGYSKGLSPSQIIENFFVQQAGLTSESDQLDLLFRLVQYIERQVVLFDALEDASFKEIHDLGGTGTLKHLAMQVESREKKEQLGKKLQDFSAQFVLTAHPTQFYRDAVLGIIHDISKAVDANNETQVYNYLQQLGRTPFFQKQKPTPYDEAVTLIWYLEHVFYYAIGKVVDFFKTRFPGQVTPENPIMKMGFWPGGDRDGNPFVSSAITIKVATALRQAAIKCYYQDVRKLKRRLTFKGVDIVLAELETRLYNQLFVTGNTDFISKSDILKSLGDIRGQLLEDHNGLFVGLVEGLITRVEVFGLHFASLDVRQESSVHGKVLNLVATKSAALPSNYPQLRDDEKITLLFNAPELPAAAFFEDEVERDTIESARAVRSIQEINGEAGCHRYIISQCNSALNVIEVYGIFLLAGWKKENLSVDIVPLFETVEDLENAADIMRELYSNAAYKAHLGRRGNKQTIMVGFSDGTKDGGYLMANWGIYKAKEELTSISKEYAIDVLFFDGRGGPPARGGGKTHNFYASLGNKISGKEIQLTIQGQTVSSNFGTVDAAQYNIEQLIHAGISNELFPAQNAMPMEHYQLIQELADEGYEAYKLLKNHDQFANYLLHASPLRFYADTNIGSRPAKRGGGTQLTLKDLRAIPFVGAWSQIKQNVTGYYGVGAAFDKLHQAGRWEEVKELYSSSLFFKTLIDNCEMAMKKCFFPLTAFLSNHPQFGGIWNMLHEEYERTKRYIFLLTGETSLMENLPVDQLSIEMRERIVLPLLSIQQFAITKVRAYESEAADNPLKQAYEKLIMRCSFGIINSGRNSA
ncbi:MAG: phosphoenolpyruvate carboxylase [Chitinophagaceae bacterium]|nr:MAG: phosphoenolpyruvate carboxylase [Chitinophagaceae bacterium]